MERAGGGCEPGHLATRDEELHRREPLHALAGLGKIEVIMLLGSSRER